MATTTPNFGWAVPTSTDLVKDGAVAIETLGDSIDASLLDLKGGTTGQVLSKASNTDMDFTWVTDAAGDITGVTAGTGISGGGTSGTVTVTNSMATAITTAGDLIKGTGSGTFDRLGIGTTGQILTVTAGAPAWATPAGGGGKVLQVVQATYSTETSTTSTSYVDTGLSASITPSSSSSKILVMYNIDMRRNNTSDTDVQSYFQLLRGATSIAGTLTIGNYHGSTNGQWKSNLNWSYLDSPATTSSTTYKVQMRSNASAITTVAQTDNNTSTMILMEIGA
jgi:hypothetical protein